MLGVEERILYLIAKNNTELDDYLENINIDEFRELLLLIIKELSKKQMALESSVEAFVHYLSQVYLSRAEVILNERAQQMENFREDS